MDGRSSTLIVALALTGSAFAGCIDNLDWLSTNSAEVSALENKGVADDAALAWAPNAQLVGVMAFELSQTPDPRITSDPDPGNGLAPAWWYVYADQAAKTASAQPRGDESASASEESWSSPKVKAFKVTSAGNVSSEEDAAAMAMGMEHDAQPISEWSIDSDAALAKAKTNATFAKVAQGFNASLIEGLASYAGVTAWWVSAMSADGMAMASVDAVTGEILQIETMDTGFEMPEFEWDSAAGGMSGSRVHVEGAGVASPGDAPVEEFFSTTSAVWGTLSFEYTPMMPGDGLHWAILDSEGEPVAIDHLGGWSGRGGAYEFDIELDGADMYTLSIGYMSSIPGPSFLPLPVGGSVEYSYVLHLTSGPMDAKHDH